MYQWKESEFVSWFERKPTNYRFLSGHFKSSISISPKFFNQHGSGIPFSK